MSGVKRELHILSRKEHARYRSWWSSRTPRQCPDWNPYRLSLSSTVEVWNVNDSAHVQNVIYFDCRRIVKTLGSTSLDNWITLSYSFTTVAKEDVSSCFRSIFVQQIRTHCSATVLTCTLRWKECNCIWIFETHMTWWSVMMRQYQQLFEYVSTAVLS